MNTCCNLHYFVCTRSDLAPLVPSVQTPLHIQSQDVILGSDYRLEHEKVLVVCLTLDRGLVEAAEGMHDALLALARRSVNP